MSHAALVLFTLMSITILVFITPGVVNINSGRLLQTIALWLAIFLGLSFIYKMVGPESEHPWFGMPQSMEQGYMQPETEQPATEAPAAPNPPAATQPEAPKPNERSF